MRCRPTGRPTYAGCDAVDDEPVEFLSEFVSGNTFEDYESNALLRSAVERQFEVLGEALNRVKRYDEELASQVPDLAKVVALASNIAQDDKGVRLRHRAR